MAIRQAAGDMGVFYLEDQRMKKCFKCGQVKEISEFYVHKRMADGHLGKCKECTKADVSKWYDKTIEKRKEYEKLRSQTKKRKSLKLLYQNKRRKNNKNKEMARRKLNNYVKNCKIYKQPCEICGKKNAEAHHEDYSKPLDVRWLCFKHHRLFHGQRNL